MIKINNSIVNALSRDARKHERKRLNYNFHTDYQDPVNRMLNALEPETYVWPHRHKDPDKPEIFLILKGRLAVIEFDDTGNIVDHIVLDHASGVYGVEIEPRVWHTAIALEPGTVVYEIKLGPYVATTDKNFAPWAPHHTSPESATYNNEILQKLNL